MIDYGAFRAFVLAFLTIAMDGSCRWSFKYLFASSVSTVTTYIQDIGLRSSYGYFIILFKVIYKSDIAIQLYFHNTMKKVTALKAIFTAFHTFLEAFPTTRIAWKMSIDYNIFNIFSGNMH